MLLVEMVVAMLVEMLPLCIFLFGVFDCVLFVSVYLRLCASVSVCVPVCVFLCVSELESQSESGSVSPPASEDHGLSPSR